MHPLLLTSGSCRSTRTRPTPTRGGRSGWRHVGTPCEAIGQRTGERPVAHSSGSTPEALHQPHLLAGQLVAVPGKRALEVLPRLPQEVRVKHSPASQLSQYVLAHDPPSDTTAVVASVYRGTRRREAISANVGLRVFLGVRHALADRQAGKKHLSTTSPTTARRSAMSEQNTEQAMRVRQVTDVHSN
jgi:hypothetical protein